MKTKKLIASLGLAAGLALSSGAAHAAVIDFSGGNDGSADGVSLSCSTTGFLNSGPCSVSLTGSGLGVRGGFIDTQPGQLDGFGGTESITISFAHEVVWTNIRFSRWDRNDNAFLEADGGVSVNYGGNNPSLALPGVVSRQLTITAIQSLPTDDFRIHSIEIAPIPLPAAGGFLLAALGGLAFLRSRKKA